MKKLYKAAWVSTLLSLILLSMGCSPSTNTQQIINSPSKIIIFNKGLSKELTSKDEIFSKIVDLTNKRIDPKKLTTAKDIVDDTYIASLKKENLSMEFIYNTEQEMNIKGDNFIPFKYYKLFFTLESEQQGVESGSVIYTFQHSDKEHYTEFSRGKLKLSKELINLTRSISEK